MKNIAMNSHRLTLTARLWVALAFGLGASLPQAHAQATAVVNEAVQQAPDAFIRDLTSKVLEAVRADKTIQSGDTRKLEALVNSKILPYLSFEEMTASAVGRNWNQATPAQKKRLQQEFKTLLLYTYSGAISQIRDQTVDVRPVRASPSDTKVVVKTLVRGRGDPIQLDYRLERTPEGWKIYDVNVLGAWLVQNYRSSFAQDISSIGLDGLITKLSDRNRELADKKADKKSGA